jgi:alpha-L-fucosidase
MVEDTQSERDRIAEYWQTRSKDENNKELAKITRENETKERKFSRLMSIRSTRVIKSMERLRPLSNTNTYKYSTEQIEEVERALTEYLEDVLNNFSGTSEKKEIVI